MPFAQLADHRDRHLEGQIQSIGRLHGLHNLFNPSVLTHQGRTYIAIRGNTFPLYRPFRSYLIEFSAHDDPTMTDLTEAAANVGVGPVADPKLLMLDGEVYATFNTGHYAEGTNDIYLVKVSGDAAPFQRVDFRGRRRIEKNWAFFRQADGRLGVLYNLAPFETLHLSAGELGTGDDLIFGTQHKLDQPAYMQPLHIGTQLAMTSGTRALLIANERFTAFRRAVYYGRLVEIDFAAGAVQRIGQKRLINAWRTFRRPKPLHNPSLMTATYFSGIFAEGEFVTASFGVNDVDFGIARVRIDELW